MRTNEDIKQVKFTGKGSVTIDLETAEKDPAYLRLAGQHDMTDATQRDLVLSKYLAFYFGWERMFQDLPCTTGPGDIFPIEMEVVHATSSYGTSNKSDDPSYSA
jgi:hypothetical protein